MPRTHLSARALTARLSPALLCPALARFAALAVLLAAVVLPATPARAAAPAESRPQLWLPTPPGEPWRVIQGYACGTHNSWDRYSLDLVHAEGRTYDAPVRAAADGTIFIWVRGSGTLILDHGGGFYTMYTHMATAAFVERGRMVSRGTVIGTVGDRGAPGTPHLHFTAFAAQGASAHGRQSVPLTFAEGYTFPETGGCSQHGGAVVVAGTTPVLRAPGIAFNAPVELNRWYSSDVTIEFGGAGVARGFSAAWGAAPAADAPAVTGTKLGTARLGQAGEGLHTLFVRGWDEAGQQSVSTFGPVGFDVTPPRIAPLATVLRAAPGSINLTWDPGTDNGSGIAGYRLYLGDDPAGTSEWFVPAPATTTPALAPGAYLLRVQPIDYAGNKGVWVTVGAILVER
jgi:hypothetical protein